MGVVFMPTHTAANACEGKVFTIEMHHTRHETAKPGDNVGLNIKGLVKQNMPRVGDVMIYKKDNSLNSNEMAEVVFVPQQPLVVDSFKNCEGLSRIAFLDGNTAVMLGKVTTVVAKSDMPAEEVKAKKK